MGSVAVNNLVLLGLCLTSLAACATKKPKVTGIRVGMTKRELTSSIGAPLEMRDPVANQTGQLEEVWVYVLDREVGSARDVTVGVLTSGVGFFDDPTAENQHLFVFVDDRLMRWGKAGAK